MRNFDDAAATWDNEPRRIELTQAVARAIRSEVPLAETMHALELGCGTGLLTTELAAHLGRVTAVDSSEGMLAVLGAKIEKRGLSRITPLCLDLAGGASPPGRFDLIYTSMTLHHVADTEKLLGRCADLLLPGGFIALSDLDTEDGSFHPDAAGVHHRGFDRKALESILSDLGFTGLGSVTAHTIRKPRQDGTEGRYSVFLIVGRKNGLSLT